MTTVVPALICIAGEMAYGVLLVKQDLFPGLSPEASVVINTVGIALSSALLSVSAVLSFYGFFKVERTNKLFLFTGFAASVLLAMMFCHYHFGYLKINRALNERETDQWMVSKMLPWLVDMTSPQRPADERKKAAQMAYEIGGLKLTYQSESGDWLTYEPTQQEIKNNLADVKMNKALQETRKTSPGLLNADINIVYILFVTLSFGLIWLAIQKSPVKVHVSS